MVKNKTVFWVQAAGWSGLIAASGMLEMYKMTGNVSFIISLAIVVIFSAYVLATAHTSRWQKTSFIGRVSIFCLIFVSLIQTFFLWLAYRSVKNSSKPS